MEIRNAVKNQKNISLLKTGTFFLAVQAVSLFSMADSVAQGVKYKRSSLHMVLMETDKFPNKEVVIDAYIKNPFPDKYNKHTVGKESFDQSINDKDLLAAGFLKDTLKNPFQLAKAVASMKNLRYLNPEKTMAFVLPSESEEAKIKIDKFISESKLAKQMVGKWFSYDNNGNFNDTLITSRGKYSASVNETNLSKSMQTANSFFYDEDLIKNSFVVINKLKFYSNEPVARVIYNAALDQANSVSIPMLKEKALKLAKDIYDKTKEGYTVFATSYLYQLEWNKEVYDKFNLLCLQNQDPMKRKAFWDTTSVFKLKFVGDEFSSSLVTFKIGEKRTEEQIIRLAVSRNIDNVFAKLQKKYVVFRPVTPVSTAGPLTAKIGLKEGLEPGQTFEILESRKDELTGTYVYKSIGSAKVSKKLPIWDNRAGADQEPVLDEKGQVVVTPEYTTFDGGKKAEAGVHFLRLKK